MKTAIIFYICPMQKKWYIIAFLTLLSLFGLVKGQQVALPNQEIVLKFANSRIASEEAMTALALVENKLQELGALNIQVTQCESGLIKLSYYSEKDVSRIKENLIEIASVQLDAANQSKQKRLPILDEDSDLAYQLDVHELVKKAESDWDFDGKAVISPKFKSDRYTNTHDYLFNNYIESTCNKLETNNSYKLQKHLALAIKDVHGVIPEVRAGPALC